MASADDTIAKLAAQAAGTRAAASATAQLDAAIKAEQAALAGLGGSLDAAKAKMAAMQAAASVNVAAYRKQAQAIRDLEAAQKSSAASLGKMSGAREGIAAAEAATRANEAAAASARDASSSFDASQVSISGMTQALKSAGPEGYAVALAITALSGALVVLVAGMLAGAAAAISVTEKLSRMSVVLTALAGSAAGGAAALAMVQSLGKALPFATSQIADWAKSLMSAGFQAGALKSAIEAVAAASALMGEEGGAAAEKMLKTLQEGGQAATQMMKQIQEGGRKSATLLAEMGLTMHDLAQAAGMTDAAFKRTHMTAEQMQRAIEAALKQKGAGPLAEMAMTWPVILAKVQEGVMSLFDKLGPAVKPFMTAVKSLFAEFSKGGSVINFLKPIVTSVFSVAFSWATKAVVMVKSFVAAILASTKSGGALAAIWAGVKVVFAALSGVFKEVANAIRPSIALIKAVFSNAQVLNGLKAIFKVIAVVILVVLVVLAKLAAYFITTAVNIIAAVAMWVGYIAGTVGVVTGFVGEVVDALAGLVDGASDAASGFIDGLVGGISAGAGAIVAAVSGLAGGAVAAFKGALQIASPSRVMMGLGGHMATGVAEGVDAGAPKAQAATAAMVDPKALKVGGAKGGGAGKSVTFTGCTFGSVSESQIREWTMKALEEDGFAGPEASTA